MPALGERSFFWDFPEGELTDEEKQYYLYNAQDLSSVYESMYTTGVSPQFAVTSATDNPQNYIGSSLAVVSGEGLQVVVSQGVAMIKGRSYIAALPVRFTVRAGAVTDIVLRMDLQNSKPQIYTAAKERPQGAALASNITHDALVYEIVLATVTVPVGGIQITPLMLTDQRLNTAAHPTDGKPLSGLMRTIPADLLGLWEDYQRLEQYIRDTWAALLERLQTEWNTMIQADKDQWNALISSTTTQWAGFMSTSGNEWSGFKTQSTNEWNALKSEKNNQWSGFMEQSGNQWDTYTSETEAAWDTWFASVQASLTDDAAGQLFNLITAHKNDGTVHIDPNERTGWNSHVADATKHITASERVTWNAKETPSGAQAKADAAATTVQNNLNAHAADTTKHITVAERNAWNGKVDKSSTVNATLYAGGWAGGAAPYSQAVSVAGTTATNVVELIPATSINTTQMEALQYANIQGGGQSANSLTLKAWGDKPTVDIPVVFVVRRDL